ncbi:uncharacterized protein nell3 [Hippocampus comes]|uniref:uncharacterized protein nell3 n=1 Tax=Hippocampus comes TaxID=109280 RepID=UPI00094E232B|nr:PREDICTED: uncharacterized protein LOC109527556 [Hippocampus comes]XP_019745107.1 PREDICTED: uncharacterized protein LOC109527556 [Hippocampus comes]XP_019745108.1 PREDICTED: uncharacterized protein LOC109527556 [Hippocampus comes]XP_019745109.1 PREDICTED: uncharacterized protein LOC109527556 [Hippocampus comes]
MLRSSLLLLLVLSSVRSDWCKGGHCSGSSTGDPRPCTGDHCPSGRSNRPARHAQPGNRHSAPSSGSPRLRSIGAAVAPACTDADCARAPKTSNQTRDCKGFECRLPLRIIRPKERARDGAGGSPPSPAAVQSPPVHLADRAAQFLGDIPEFGPPSSDLGGAPLGVQLTCDVKPGENEVPSEDALILHLQLAKGQEKLVEALRAQQLLIGELQQKLADQQEALLSQQRDVLTQQHRMYEQMDAVKAQYGLLTDVLKQASFQGLQGELQNYFQSHLVGLQSQARGHMHNVVHKVDTDAKVMDVVGEAHFPQLLMGCASACQPDHYCDFQSDPPQCHKCTVCPPGFFLISECSPTMDTMCQDRDECLELANICGERVKCLNTPGGFRCLGVSQKEAETGLCGHAYFYNQELQECQACSDCEGHPVAFPCTAVTDSVCGSPPGAHLSESWSASITVPSAQKSGSHMFAGLQLSVRGKEHSDLLSSEGGRVTFRQHGLLWLDYNFAIKHSCRNFLQVGLRFNSSQEEEDRELSGVRVEQPEGKYYQGVSVSGGVEAEPNDTVSLLLRSPNQYCNQSTDVHVYDTAAPTFSLLWLSHDTGAVAMTAEMSLLAQYQSSYSPTFRAGSLSDPYMIGLTHDNRGVRFTESGVVKFVLQQALYAMGHTCVREGFFLIAYTSRNGTGQEAMRAFKTGVNYRDTSITLAGAVALGAGDTLSFEITTPPQCNVRYFGDGTGISTLSLVWLPSAVASTLTATVAKLGLPFGAVRNKPLSFQQISPDSQKIRLAGSGEPNSRKNFVFLEEGTASVALNLRLIHSCNVVKVTLHRTGSPGPGGTDPVAQQVSGHMPEGSEWASVGLRASFHVRNGTAVYVTLDCIRGRINQISHQGGTSISILWVAV